MNKKILSLVTMFAVVIAFTFNFSNPVQAAPVKKKVTVTIGKYTIKLNNKKQKTQTLTYGSTTYIPITSVAGLTGAKVKKSKSTYNFIPLTAQEIGNDLKTEYEAQLNYEKENTKRAKTDKELRMLYSKFRSFSHVDEFVMIGRIQYDISSGKDAYAAYLDNKIRNEIKIYERDRKEIITTIASIKSIIKDNKMTINEERLSRAVEDYDKTHTMIQSLYQMLKISKETGGELDSEFGDLYINAYAYAAAVSDTALME